MNPPAVNPPSQNQKLMELLGMDRMSLSSKTRAAQSRSEQWMRYLGFPGGILLFLLIYYLPPGAGLSASAQAGAACFALALVWWVTEPFPTYLTSLVLMFLLLITRTSEPKAIMDVLGMEVIWLNLLAFILSSMLVKVRLAKRMALWLILRFGRKASWALMAFVIIQMVLAPLIPATAARAVMTLPLMIVVAAIYGATEETQQQLRSQPVSAQPGRHFGVVVDDHDRLLGQPDRRGFDPDHGRRAGLLHGLGSCGRADRHHGDDDDVVARTAAGVSDREARDRVPQLEGGLGSGGAAVRRARSPAPRGKEGHRDLWPGAVSLDDRCTLHMGWFGVEISAPFAALLGAVLVLFPQIRRACEWSEAEIPWHLLIFSAGAYAGGLALDDTGAPLNGACAYLLGGMDLKGVPFGVSYTVIIAVMMYSHLAHHIQDGAHTDPPAHHHHDGQGARLAADRLRVAGRAVHRLGRGPADQRQAQRDPVLDQPVLGGRQLQVRRF
jgi:sodium-dependent dicarboxylate transporter 2/3/5